MTAANPVWSQTLDAVYDGNQVAMSSPAFDVARDWSACQQKLYAIGELANDWDGLGADAPSHEIVDTAFAFLAHVRAARDVRPPDRIVASPDGSIVFEWQEEDGRRTEAEISQRNVIEYCEKELGGEPKFAQQRIGFSSFVDDPPWAAHSAPATSVAA